MRIWICCALLTRAAVAAEFNERVPSVELPQARLIESPLTATQVPALSVPALPTAGALETVSQVPEISEAVPDPAQSPVPVVGTSQVTAPDPQAQPGPQPSPEAKSLEAAVQFDGAAAAGPWSAGEFPSADGETAVRYKNRPGFDPETVRVFSGGLALNESFETLFAKQQNPTHGQDFIWMRGHPPTAWTPTRSVIDADARDLARMVLRAADGARRVELVLHSFGTLVFQRMVQLRGEPEVDAALRLVKRAVLLNATTHYEGSEKKAGQAFEQMGQATRAFVGWLDVMDQEAEVWRSAARLNPFMIPAASMYLAQWQAMRSAAIAMASRDAASMMRKDLSEPWDPGIDHVRRDFLAALEKDSHDSGWQEALLRRSSGMFHLDFSAEDVRHIHQLGIRLDLVHSAKDQLLNWASAKTLFDLLGIKAPDAAPPSGTVLRDGTGRFRARIVDADHYFPLKQPEALARILDP